MATPVRRRRLLAFGSVLFAHGTGAMADPPGCVSREFGPFSLCVPPTWTQTKGGTDSATGWLKADGVDVHYDLGLYSDPLRVPAEATQVRETQTTVDGLAARQVRYAMRRGEALPMHYLGLHVPQVRRTGMGWLKLTLLAYVRDPQRLGEVDAVLLTVRLAREPTR